MKKIIFFNEQKNIIAESLLKFRIQRGLSQSALAAKMQTLGCNIDQQMISKIEKNKRQVTDYEFACFCIALQVDPSELLFVFLNEFDNH